MSLLKIQNFFLVLWFLFNNLNWFGISHFSQKYSTKSLLLLDGKDLVEHFLKSIWKKWDIPNWFLLILIQKRRNSTTELTLTYPRYLLQKEGNRRRPHPLQGMNRRKSRDFHINRDDQMNCQPDIESHKMGSKSVWSRIYSFSPTWVFMRW